MEGKKGEERGREEKGNKRGGEREEEENEGRGGLCTSFFLKIMELQRYLGYS